MECVIYLMLMNPFALDFEACPSHSPFRFVHLMHRNLSMSLLYRVTIHLLLKNQVPSYKPIRVRLYSAPANMKDLICPYKPVCTLRV